MAEQFDPDAAIRLFQSYAPPAAEVPAQAEPVTPPTNERLALPTITTRGFTQNLAGKWALFTEAFPALINQMAGRTEEAEKLYSAYEKIQQELAEANRRGEVPTDMENINSPMDAARYALYYMGYGLGEAATFIPTMIVGAGVGGVGARAGAWALGRTAAERTAAGRIGAEIGMHAGLAGATAIPNIGETGAGVWEAGGRDQNAAYLAGAAGVAKSLLDYAPIARLISRAGIGTGAATSAIERGILRRMGREVALNAPIEGLTEGAQEAIDAAVESAYKEGFWTPETALRIGNSALAGAVMGIPAGAMAGALQPRGGHSNEANNTPAPPAGSTETEVPRITTPEDARSFLLQQKITIPNSLSDESVIRLANEQFENFTTDLNDRQEAGQLTQDFSDPKTFFGRLIEGGVNSTGFTFKDAAEALNLNIENKYAVEATKNAIRAAVRDGFLERNGTKWRARSIGKPLQFSSPKELLQHFDQNNKEGLASLKSAMVAKDNGYFSFHGHNWRLTPEGIRQVTREEHEDVARENEVRRINQRVPSAQAQMRGERPFEAVSEEQLIANRLLSALGDAQPGALEALYQDVMKDPQAKRSRAIVRQVMTEQAGIDKKLASLDPQSEEAIALRTQRANIRGRLEGIRDGTATVTPSGEVNPGGDVGRLTPNTFSVDDQYRTSAAQRAFEALQEKEAEDKVRNIADYKEKLNAQDSRGLALSFQYNTKTAPRIGQNFRNYLDFSDFNKLDAEKKNLLDARMREAGYVDEDGRWTGLWDAPQSSTNTELLDAAKANQTQGPQPQAPRMGVPLPDNFDPSLTVPPGALDYITSLQPGDPVSVLEMQNRWAGAGNKPRLQEVKAFLNQLSSGAWKGVLKKKGDGWVRGDIAETPTGWSQRGLESPEVAQQDPAFLQSNLATNNPHSDVTQSVVKNLLGKMLGGAKVAVKFVNKLRAADFPATVEHLQAKFGMSKEQAEAVMLAGLWNKHSGLLQLSLEQTPEQVNATAFHEGFHAMEDLGYFTPQELALLTQNRSEVARWYNKAFGQDFNALPEKEKRAYTAQWYYENAKNGRPTSIGNRIWNTIERLKNWLNGLGFQTQEDLVKAIEDGTIAQRTINSHTFPGLTVDPTATDPAFMKNTEPIDDNIKYVKKEQPSFALWRRWLNSTSHLAEVYPILKPVQQLFDRMRGLHAELMNTSYIAASKIMEFTPARRTEITKLMAAYDAASVDPVVKNGVLSQGGITITDPKEIAAVMAIHEQSSRLFNTAMLALTKNVYGVDPTDVTQRGARGYQAAKAYYERLLKERRKGYLPHIRIGSHYAVVKNAKGEVQSYVAFDKKGPLANVNYEQMTLKYLREKYPGQQIEVGERTSDKDRGLLLQNMTNLEQFIQMMVDDGAKRDAKTDAYISNLIDKLRKNKELAFSNVFRKKRKDVDGWMLPWQTPTYLEDALPRYYNGAAKAIVRLNSNKVFNNLIAGYSDPVTKVHQKGLQEINPKMAEWAKNTYDYIMAPASPWAANLKSMAFHWQLGFALDSAMVNALQMPTSTVPYFGMFANPIKVGALVLKNMSRAGWMMSNIKTPETGFIDYKKLISDLKVSDPELGNRIEYLAENGLLSPIYGDEIRRQVDISRYGYSKGLENTVNKALEVSASFFSYVEQMNRIATAMTAYDLAKDEKFNQKFNQYHEQKGWTVDPKQFTDPLTRAMGESIARTQFTGAEYDKPQIARANPFLQVFTQFMPVMIKLTENYWKNAASLIKEPGMRVYAGRHLLLQTAAIVGIAGAFGLPFAPFLPLLYDLARFLSTGIAHDFVGDLRDYLNLHTGVEFTRVFMKGFPYAAGFDLSTRADINPVRPQQFANAGFENLAGPAGASIINPLNNLISAYKEGRDDWWNLAQAVMPRAFGNVMRAYGYSQEGLRTQPGTPLLSRDQVTDRDIGLRAVGITSRHEADARALERDRLFANNRNKVAKERATEDLAGLMVQAMRAPQDSQEYNDLVDRYVNRFQMYLRRDEQEEDPSARLRISPNTVRDRAKQLLRGVTDPNEMRHRLNRQNRGEVADNLLDRY